MSALTRILNQAIAAAATLTGRRFGLLVASSLVATSAIVAAAMTNPGGSGLAAALLGRSLAADTVPAASAPEEPSSSPVASSARPTHAATPAGTSLESPAPTESPEASGPKDEAEAPATPSAPPPSSPGGGRIKHVFVISLTSPGYEAAFGATPQMPYLATTLRPQGQLLSGYSLLDSGSLPNAIAAVSGQPANASTTAGCPTYAEFPSSTKLDKKGVVSGAGCVYPVETLTIADQLVGARFRWHAYMEGMVDETGKPANCVHPAAETADEPPLGGYAARQNPFVYFHSLLDLGDCATNDLPLTQLQTDLRKVDSTPNYSFISPNLCNAGVVGQCPPGTPEGAASADAFLAQWVPKILASPAYKKDGVLVVTFTGVNPPDPAVAASSPPSTQLKVGALLLSRFVPGGATDATPYDPYSLLRSTEDLFGLQPLGLAGASKTKSFAAGLLGETSGD